MASVSLLAWSAAVGSVYNMGDANDILCWGRFESRQTIMMYNEHT